jgi:hypothetical protein
MLARIAGRQPIAISEIRNLRNFHETSHGIPIAPMLVATRPLAGSKFV